MPSIELWAASWLLDVSIKAALLALAAWAGMAAFRVRSGTVKHRMWLFVYWFHPVAWLVRRRLIDLAEQVCDDAVIQVTGSRQEYVQNLLDMAARVTAASGRLRPVGVAMARKANVVKRIEAIIDDDRPLSRRIGAAGGVLLACLMTPLVLLAAGLRLTAPTAAAEAAAAAARSEKRASRSPRRPVSKAAS